MRCELDLRNMNASEIIDYLVECGGSLRSDRRVTGCCWSGELRRLEPACIGPVLIPRDLLILEGDDEKALQEVATYMRRKTMRAGG
jgi:hypothetical protein